MSKKEVIFLFSIAFLQLFKVIVKKANLLSYHLANFKGRETGKNGQKSRILAILRSGHQRNFENV